MAHLIIDHLGSGVFGTMLAPNVRGDSSHRGVRRQVIDTTNNHAPFLGRRRMSCRSAYSIIRPHPYWRELRMVTPKTEAELV